MNDSIRSDEISELLKALLEAEKSFTPVSKDGFNNHLKHRYASLGSVLDAVKPALTANGVLLQQTWLEPLQYESLVNQKVIRTPQGQPTDKTEEVRELVGRMTLLTTLFHAPSAQYMTYEYPVLLKLGDGKDIGAAMTYARKYHIMAILGLAPSDETAEDLDARPVQNAGKSSSPTVSAPAKTVGSQASDASTQTATASPSATSASPSNEAKSKAGKPQPVVQSVTESPSATPSTSAGGNQSEASGSASDASLNELKGQIKAMALAYNMSNTDVEFVTGLKTMKGANLAEIKQAHELMMKHVSTKKVS